MVWLWVVLWGVMIAVIIVLVLTVRRRRQAHIAARVWRPDRGGHRF